VQPPDVPFYIRGLYYKIQLSIRLKSVKYMLLVNFISWLLPGLNDLDPYSVSSCLLHQDYVPSPLGLRYWYLVQIGPHCSPVRLHAYFDVFAQAAGALFVALGRSQAPGQDLYPSIPDITAPVLQPLRK
jgi:hypothetical protein